MKWRPIETAKGYRDGRPLWLKGENLSPYVTLGYWTDDGWWEITTQGQALLGVTHWAPLLT